MSTVRDVVQPPYELVIEVDGDLEDELLEAMDYLRERLLGDIPDVLSDLASAVSGALWQGYAAGGVAVVLTNDAGEPIGAPVDQTPEEAAREEEAIASYSAWVESNEGQAELERENQFYDFLAAHADETAELERAWLNDRAEQFTQARNEWQRERRAALQTQFDAAAAASKEK